MSKKASSPSQSSKKRSTKARNGEKARINAALPFEVLCEADERINPAIILAEELMRKDVYLALEFEDLGDDPETDFENFYIFSLNYDLCCEEIEYEYLHVSYVAGLILYFRDDEEIWEFFANNYNVAREELPEMRVRPNQNIWSLDKTGKIELYINLLELVDHWTGNPWLDTVNCQGGGASCATAKSRTGIRFSRMSRGGFAEFEFFCCAITRRLLLLTDRKT